MLNTMIPISLYVTLEIVKVAQMFLLNDVDMYDKTSNTPMEARTSAINEELGQIRYIYLFLFYLASCSKDVLTGLAMYFRTKPAP